LKKPTNAQIADILERISDALEARDANPFRVRAYHEGATVVRDLDEPVADFVHEKRFDDLTALPKIGDGIAAVIDEIVTLGHSNLLQDLEANEAEAAFMQVPGIGEELAQRIINELEISSLPELEVAAHDGRLEGVPGFGQRRVKGVRTALAGMLSRSAQLKQQERTAGKNMPNDDRPPVDLLLDIDREYRQRAANNELHRIAPRRFNPDNEEWLPVMHTKHQGWSFTVLFSNTAQAHQLGKTDDWVVIYYERDNLEHQNTVVTETQGPLKGKRVVRGREIQTKAYYGV
jgi:Holliday junction resolvasome RuvABC DNA-binding subunit